MLQHGLLPFEHSILSCCSQPHSRTSSDFILVRRGGWEANERDLAPSRGVQIFKDTCTCTELSTDENVILDASYLAGADVNTGKNFTLLPFRFVS